jgi:hypothetical protein
MARKRLRKLADLVETTPEMLTEVIEEVFRECLNELDKPNACRRIAQDLRLHEQRRPGVHESQTRTQRLCLTMDPDSALGGRAGSY